MNTTGWALFLLGWAFWCEGCNYIHTIGLYEQSLSLFQEIRSVFGVAYVSIFLAGIEQAVENYARSQMLYEETIVLARERGKSSLLGLILAGLGSLARAGGKTERAARLLGAGETSVKEFFSNPNLPNRAAFDSDVATVRTQLDEDIFRVAWAEGQAMTLEEAVAYALGEN
jgi:hypothetical protein